MRRIGRPRWRSLPQRRMARPREGSGWVPGPRARIAIGWIAAAAGVVLIALLVGRPSEDAGVVRSPSPSPEPGAPITFGTALDPASGEAVGDTSRFAAGQTFAYSAETDGPVPERVYVEVVRVDPGAGEVVQPAARQDLSPDSRLIAFQTPADGLLAEFGTGTFEMRIYLDPGGRPVAQGRFTLVATSGLAG